MTRIYVYVYVTVVYKLCICTINNRYRYYLFFVVLALFCLSLFIYMYINIISSICKHISLFQAHFSFVIQLASLRTHACTITCAHVREPRTLGVS